MMLEGGAISESEGCSSHACLISPPKGMGTNSGKCYCSQEKVRRHIQSINLQLSEYKKALEDIAGRSCCDEICIGPCSSSRAKAALGVTKKQEGVVFYCPRCGGQIR